MVDIGGRAQPEPREACSAWPLKLPCLVRYPTMQEIYTRNIPRDKRQWITGEGGGGGFDSNVRRH